MDSFYSSVKSRLLVAEVIARIQVNQPLKSPMLITKITPSVDENGHYRYENQPIKI